MTPGTEHAVTVPDSVPLVTGPALVWCARCEWAGKRADLPRHARDAGHPLCIACAALGHAPRSLPADRPQVCVTCDADVHRMLGQIVDLYAVLPAAMPGIPPQLGEPRRGNGDRMPGGDALVLLAGGSAGRSQTLTGVDTSHEADEYPGDTQSAAWVLGSWEDAWRDARGEHGYHGPATVAGAVTYLRERTRWRWAVVSHPAWDEFAADVHSLYRRLRAADGLTERPAVADAACFSEGCDGRLERPLRDPQPCRHRAPAYERQPIAGYDPALGYVEPLADRDQRILRWEAEHSSCHQGGAAVGRDGKPVWVCTRCRREYDSAAYHLAVAARMKQQQEQREREAS